MCLATFYNLTLGKMVYFSYLDMIYVLTLLSARSLLLGILSTYAGGVFGLIKRWYFQGLICVVILS